MFEKLLVPILAKLTNFVPEGGIWLNTQRPEWNDANNALVGNGLSVVTTCDLRRYLCLLRQWMNETDCLEFCVSVEVASLFDQHLEILRQHRGLLSSGINDEDRRNLTDRLSENGSAYRVHLYANGFSGDRRKMSVDKVRAFLDVSIAFLDHTLRSNRRHDGLYHSYNLVEFNSNQLHIRRLHEMLEGQVAILNSGLLPASEAADLLDALRQSAMYREDQQSYMLYPDRDLPRFVDKNRIPEESVSSSPLLSRLLENDDESIIRKDVEGGYHFNGDLRNSAVLEAVLRTLAEHSEYAGLVENEIGDLKQLFEATFQHHEFTGRSGTFFAYEGLGSIYWHMVSKLRLAVVEYLAREIASSDQSTNPSSVEQRLRDHYQEICYGIGATKSPCQYGAFPTEPYSHTPRHAGAQQPGMTGQVKEDILARYVELGVRVNAGQLSFDLSLFNRAEFLQHPTVMRYFDTIRNQWNQVPLAKNQFGFTICQVPVVFAKSANPKMIVHCRDGKHARSTFELTRAQSQALFAQDGLIEKIEVQFT